MMITTRTKRLLSVIITLTLSNMLYFANLGLEVPETKTIIPEPIQVREEEVEAVQTGELRPYPEADPIFWEEPKLELTAEDELVLMKIAKAEAGNQGVEGKELVMRVILNRVENSSFPNTIKQVVFAEGQFSPVSSGYYEMSNPDEECYEALKWIKRGDYKDMPALYFNNSKGDWMSQNKEFLFQHRGHYFYR